ncbi:MAG: thiamine phosphate synthase [Dehalococcoidia bacterium]
MRLPLPRLMLVTDRALRGGSEGLIAAVGEALSGGVDAVQLREKNLPPDELLPLAHRLRALTRDRALLIVNGPLEVALACEADGLHLPEAASPVERPSAGFMVGRSVHSPEAARRAEAEGADYLIAGPVYATPSHPHVPPAGVDLISEVAAAVRLPVLGIGGVSEGRVAEVIRAGAVGVAVITAVLAAPSPEGAARALRRALDAACASERVPRPR